MIKLTNTWKHAALISIASLLYKAFDSILKVKGQLDYFWLIMVIIVALAVEKNQHISHGSKRGWWSRHGVDTVVDILVSIISYCLIVFVHWSLGIIILILCLPGIIKWIRSRNG
jgi:hypothetical protein